MHHIDFEVGRISFPWWLLKRWFALVY